MFFSEFGGNMKQGTNMRVLRAEMRRLMKTNDHAILPHLFLPAGVCIEEHEKEIRSQKYRECDRRTIDNRSVTGGGHNNSVTSGRDNRSVTGGGDNRNVTGGGHNNSVTGGGDNRRVTGG